VGGALTSISQIAPALKLAQDFDFKGLKEGVSNALQYGKTILSGVVPALFAQSTATAATTGAQTGLNVAMSANPIGLVVVAIVALVGALYLLYTNVDSVKKIFDSAFAFIKDTIGGVITALSPFKDTIIEIGKYLFNVFTVPFQIAYKVFVKLAESFTSVGDKSKTFGERIAGLKPIFEGVGKVISTVFGILNKAIDIAINAIVNLLVPPIRFLIVLFSELASFIYDNLSKAFSYLMELLKPVIDGITLVVNKASDIINSFSGETENAADTAYKNIMAQSKASITELNKVKESTFKLQATDKEGIKQAK
jgi:hypothetical protein